MPDFFVCAQCAVSPRIDSASVTEQVWCAECQLCLRCCGKNGDQRCLDSGTDPDEEEGAAWIGRYETDITDHGDGRIRTRARSAAEPDDVAPDADGFQTLRGSASTLPYRDPGTDAVFFGFASVRRLQGVTRIEPMPVFMLGDAGRMLPSLSLGDEIFLYGREERRVVRTSAWTPGVDIDVFVASRSCPWFTATLDRWEAWMNSDDEFLYPDEPSRKKELGQSLELAAASPIPPVSVNRLQVGQSRATQKQQTPAG